MSDPTQMPLFDIEQARAGRDGGIIQVAEHNDDFLRLARSVAVSEAMRLGGEITMDDVRRVCPVAPRHYNAWGAVFKTDQWVWTGRYRQSAMVQGHGNMQRVWRLA